MQEQTYARRAHKIAPKYTIPTDTLFTPALLSGAGASAGGIHIDDGPGAGAPEGGDEGVFAGVGSGDSTGEGARGSTGEGVGATEEAGPGAGARGSIGEGARGCTGAGVGARGSAGEGARGCIGKGVGARGSGSAGDGVGTSCAGGKSGEPAGDSDTTDLNKNETSMRIKML